MAWIGKSKLGTKVKNFILTVAILKSVLIPLGEVIAQDGKNINNKYIMGNVLLQACKDENYLKKLSQAKVDELINMTFNNAAGLAVDFQKVHQYEMANEVLQKALVSSTELNLSEISKSLTNKIADNKIECGKYIISQISSPYTSARERAKILEHVFIKHGLLKLVQDENQYKAIEDTLINKTESEYNDFIQKTDYTNAINLLEQMRLFGELKSFDGLATFCEKKIIETESIISEGDKPDKSLIVFQDPIAQSINLQMEREHKSFGTYTVDGKEYVASFKMVSEKDPGKAVKEKKKKEDLGAMNCIAKLKTLGISSTNIKKQISVVEIHGPTKYKYFIIVYYELP